MWSCHASGRRAWINERFMSILRRIYIIILGASLFGYPLTTVANLKGSQRQSVYQGILKKCIPLSTRSAPQLDYSEHRRWCSCYAGQVVDNTVPSDIKGIAVRNPMVTPRMKKVGGDAINYCKRKLYGIIPTKESDRQLKNYIESFQ